MIKVWPLFLVLAGCASAPVEVSKLDLLLKSYELTPESGWASTPSPEEAKQMLRTTAQTVCAPGMVGLLDVERPDYIRLEATPRGYLHCR